jgi:hypothetical protein
MPVQLLPRDAVQRPTKARSTVLAVAAVVLAVVLGACGTPDRKAEADRLERVIKAMPGVVDARVDYTNDSERGATLKLSVYLPDAPPQQIADAASRINKVRGEAFTAFQQTAEFLVTPNRQVRVTRDADLNPDSIAADTQSIRRFSEAVDAVQITMSGREPSTPTGLRVDEVKTPADDVFAAVRAAFGNEAQINLDMVPAAKVKMPLWSVSFPFSDEDQQRVDRQIAAMPVPIWSITVGTHGSITNLDVGLPTPDAAYQDPVSVIATTGAGPTHTVGLG